MKSIRETSCRKPLLFSLFLLTLSLTMIFASGRSMAAGNDLTDVEIIGTFGQTEARTMLDLINDFRSSSDAWYWNEDNSEQIQCTGLNDLVYDYELEEIAMQRAAEIAVYYSHTRPDGSSCFSLQYDRLAVAENIAGGSGSALDTAEEAFRLWREDRYYYDGQGHRRNMLDDTLTHIGIGHFEYNGFHFWVQAFSAPGYNTSETEACDSDAVYTIPVLSENVRGLAIALSEKSFSQKAGTVRDLPMIVPWTATLSDWQDGNYGMPVYNASLSIESSDESIAWVSGDQICTAENADGIVTFTVKATLGKFTASTSFTVTVYTKLSLADAAIKLSTYGYTYSGNEKIPEVTVTYQGTVLTEGTDYLLSHDEDMTNCGTKTITATGIGDYKDSVSAEFRINKRSYIGVVTFRYGSITVGKTEAIYHTEDSEPYIEAADIVYGSDDPSIATVDENGLVTGVGEGMTTIRITFLENRNFTETEFPIQYSVSKMDLGLAASVRLNGLPLVYNGSDQKPSVTVSYSTETLVEGQDFIVTYPEDSTNAGKKELLVTGINRCKGSKTVSYEIGKAASEITPSIDSALRISVGETAKITASAPTKISYSVYYNPSVVSVSSDGIVKGLSSGSAMIELASAESDNYYGRTSYRSVIVSDQPSVEPSGITLSKSSLTLVVGKSAALTASVSPSNASNKTVSWRSSNSSVASVDENGRITAKKYGKAVITAATSNGITASCTVQTLFKDVTDPKRSYYDAVYWAVDKGITKCTTTFKPNDGVTRSEFTAFLYRLAGTPEVTSAMKKAVRFTDVTSGTKFYNEICWAVNAGIIKGFSDGTFRPAEGLTRSQCAIMIWRYAGKPGVSIQTSPFPDVPFSNSDTCRAILWGSEKEIIRGSKGYFLPKDPCTRANVVTFLYRYAKL